VSTALYSDNNSMGSSDEVLIELARQCIKSGDFDIMQARHPRRLCRPLATVTCGSAPQGDARGMGLNLCPGITNDPDLIDRSVDELLAARPPERGQPGACPALPFRTRLQGRDI
jgi:hypothetical protein